MSSASEVDTEDANLPGSLPMLRKRNILFSKEHDEDLPARIERIWYVNPYGQEMSPPANPRVIEAIRDSQAIIYSIGSLYTSIIPSVVLRGVGEAIRAAPARHKILILNGSLDREVGPSDDPLTAFDFVEAIVRAGEQSRGVVWRPRLSSVRSDQDLRGSLFRPSAKSTPSPIPSSPLMMMLSSHANGTLSDGYERSVCRKYVTHLIHLNGEGAPVVDRDQLHDLGIDCVKIYGRKIEVAGPDDISLVKGMSYDDEALLGAIESILGKRGQGVGLSRRNTLDG